MEPPQRLITRILEFAGLFALSAFLIRLGVYYLLEVWSYLLIAAITVLAVIVGWRIYKHGRDMGKW